MDTDVLIRLSGFLGVLSLMAVWEFLAPLRPLSVPKLRRWGANLAIVGLDALLIRLLFSGGLMGVAVVAAQQRWGLLNSLGWASWVNVLIAIVVLDCTLYLQHVLFHTVPAFWRLHMMHHSDLDCDATTGVRFHPGEVALSTLIKVVVVVVIGAAPVAVLSFEVLLNATSIFNHSNVRMPFRMEGLLRWIVVTPNMHRIHHSVVLTETNSNFGFNLPWWDRLFGTYRADPARGQRGMTLGLQQFRDPARLTFVRMLALPFVGETGNYLLRYK